MQGKMVKIIQIKMGGWEWYLKEDHPTIPITNLGFEFIAFLLDISSELFRGDFVVFFGLFENLLHVQILDDFVSKSFNLLDNFLGKANC